MQEELDLHYPSSDVTILAVNELGEESGNPTAAAMSDLPILQDVDGNGDQQSDVWTAWEVAWRDVMVIDGDAILHHVVNLTPTATSFPSLEVPANYEHLLAEIVDVARADFVAAGPWQNPVEPYDVSNDGLVVPTDVLRIINRINGEGAGRLDAPSGEVSSFYDVNGDEHVTFLDALAVIRHLNATASAAGEPAGEPEAASTDAVFALAASQTPDDDER